MTSKPESIDAVGGVDVRPPVSSEADATPVADEQLLAAHDLAREALTEITPAATVGDAAGYSLEADGVVSLRFANGLDGYPGWFWTVSLARVQDDDPTVLEVGLMPGGDALLAPEWVPWAVRLADYEAQQLIVAEAAALAGRDVGVDQDDDEVDDDLDDIEDLDAADFDHDGSPILHAGDVDGVDIDELDDIDEPEDEPGDAEELTDDEFVSDEDDLGEDELQDGVATDAADSDTDPGDADPDDADPDDER